MNATPKIREIDAWITAATQDRVRETHPEVAFHRLNGETPLPAKRLAEAHKMKFECDDAVYAAIADRCKEVDIGARQVDHILNQQVLPGLSRQLLEQMATETMPKSVRMGVNGDGNFTYTFA